MAFARETHTGVDEHGPLYSTGLEGVNVNVSARERSGSAREVPRLTGFAADEYDARTMPSEREGMIVAAPDQRGVSWQDNPQRPFCSLACRLVGLGPWPDEVYAVRTGPPDDVR